jgi:hypothetical protein
MLNKRFTFLCTEEERDELTRLAQSLHRSRGDTIRLLIRDAVQAISQASEICRSGNNEFSGEDPRLGGEI